MKTLFYILGFFIISLINLYSQNQWKPSGSPTGGSINAIIEKDGYIFTAAGQYWSAGAVYRSDDNGKTWQLKINNLPANFTVYDLACNDTYIFTASTSGKVYRTSDYGEYWESSSNGIGNTVVYTVHTVGSTIYSGTSDGVYKSTDNGDSWINFNNGLTDSYVYAIYNVGDYLFAGTSDGVFRSANGGSWQEVNNGINTQYPFISSFIYKDGYLFTGLYNKLYRSTNYGTSWTEISGFQDGAYVLKVYEDKIFKANYYGIHYTTNYGQSWIAYNSPVITNIYLADFYITDGLMLAGEKELNRSEDNGNTWSFSSTGIANLETGDIIEKDGILYTSSLNVIYKSYDNGNSWVKSDTLPVYSNISSFYIFENYIFAANSGFALRSADGINWQELNILATEFTAHNGFLFATRNPQYTGTIFRSSDLGITWEDVSTPMTADVVSIVSFNGELYIGGFTGLYKSNDNGNNWIPVDYSGTEGSSVEKLYIHNNYLLLDDNSSSGLYRSVNGSDWNFYSSTLINDFYYTFESYGSILFAATYSSGVIVSYDNGESWQPFNNGLPLNNNGSVTYVKSIFAKNGLMHASVGLFSIWNISLEAIPVELSSLTANYNNASVNLNWQTASETNNRGFDIERKVNSYQSDGRWEMIGFAEGKGTSTEQQTYSFVDKNILAGKYSYRLKQIDFDGSFEYSDAVEVEVTLPNKFSLEQNYPNPFNPSTIIRYHVPVESKITVKVFNVLGKEMLTFVNDVKKAGVHEIDFTNKGELSSGVYFYILKTDNFSETKKLLLLK